MNLNFLFKRSFPAVLLILVVGIIVYANTFQVPFVFDDARSITQNDVIRSLDNFYATSYAYDYLSNRYVAYLTFALNYHFGGLNVTGFHAINLLIHLVAAMLVYVLLRLTFQTPYFREAAQGLGSQELDLLPSAFSLQPSAFIPLLAGLLFVVHPIQTQAVTYIVQRVTSLATMFYLLSVVLYVKARLSIENSELIIQNSEGKTHPANVRAQVKPWLLIAGSTLAAVLAMKTKEIAFTLPLAIVLYEICFFRGAWQRRLLYLLPLLATLPIIPMTVLDIGGSAGDIPSNAGEQLQVGHGISRPDYIFTQFRVIVTYLRLLVLPLNQNLDYDYPVYTAFFTPPVFLSFLLLTGILGLAVYLFWRTRSAIFQAPDHSSQLAVRSQPDPALPSPYLRLIAYGIFWFFLTLAVESSLIPIRDVIVEHRLYLSGFGAVAAFATAFCLMAEKLARPASGKLLGLVAVLLVLALGVATYQRNHVWGDAIRLWQDVITKSPNKARPINNLGKALENAGRRPEAFKAFSQAIKIDPRYYKAYYNLADLYLVSDQPDAALPLLQTAIKLNPGFWEAYISVGAALMRGGRFRETITFLEQNVGRFKDHPEAHFYLGASYAFLGNREAAIRELAIVSRGDPALAATLAGMLGLKPNRNVPHGLQ